MLKSIYNLSSSSTIEKRCQKTLKISVGKDFQLRIIFRVSLVLRTFIPIMVVVQGRFINSANYT
jgi:hypothetical protein